MTLYKGIDLLIIAYAILKKKYDHIRLVLKDSSDLYGIAGSKIFETLLKSRPDIITEELRASIICISENLNLSRLSELYGSCDCYASPYRAEGFNIPPLEAAACGLPVLITKGGATDDYYHSSFALQIEGQKLTLGTDTIIEPQLGSLIDKLEILIENKNSGIDKNYALNFISDKYSWRTVASALVDAFRA